MDRQKSIWDEIWSKGVQYSWDDLSEQIYRCLLEECGNFTGKTIIEAGSGTGRISLRLAVEGGEVILVDYSEGALNNSKKFFLDNKQSAQFLLADIMKMPLNKEIADLTWNAGVLEHFSFSEQVQALEEMKRVTKKEGMVITLNPNAACLPYRTGKYIAEQNGSWPYGIEVPVGTLVSAATKAGLKLLREYSIGFINALDFLNFVPGGQYVRQAMIDFYRHLSEEEKEKFPGYLLVSVMRPI